MFCRVEKRGTGTDGCGQEIVAVVVGSYDNLFDLQGVSYQDVVVMLWWC